MRLRHLGFLVFLFFFCDLGASYEKICLSSIPKSGTSLLMKAIRLLTGRRSSHGVGILTPSYVEALSFHDFGTMHGGCNKQNASIMNQYQVRGFFIYRDPRDTAVSAAHYIKKLPLVYPEFQRYSFNEILFCVMNNFCNALHVMQDVASGDIASVYRLQFLPWKNHPLVYTTTFEKLVGPHGGGNSSDQLQELKKMALHAGLNLSKEKLAQVASELFGSSSTFREGKIGSWRNYFTEEHKKKFKEIAGDLLIDLGYESNLDW